MIFEYLCPPAALYLAFSLIQIMIDIFNGENRTAFLKSIVMTIFTIALNMLCQANLGIISWFIVFIPFIFLTYLTTILFLVFGISPKKHISANPTPNPRPRQKKQTSAKSTNSTNSTNSTKSTN